MSSPDFRLSEAAGTWPGIELREVRVFLILAEELHFGRTAERLVITPSRVSQTIRTLEARVGGKLFERTSRRVRLTPLGERLRERLGPAYAALELAVESTHQEAKEPTGLIRIGFTGTTEGPVLTRLVKKFRAHHPGYEVTFHELDVFDPYSGLRKDEIDVLYHHFPVTEPDLTAGPELAQYDLVLAVARGHRLASMATVSIEDLADEELARIPPTFPSSLYDLYLPRLTPSGRRLRRTHPVRTMNEILMLVAQGRIVWPMSTITPRASAWDHDEIVFVPFTDLGPAVVGLIWRTGHEDAGIRALASIARALDPVTTAAIDQAH
jgi:DNA-binding transcriptional LysR family regulator